MPPLRATVRRYQGSLPFMVLVTGGSGFLLSALTRPAWQGSVETAQALAGLVTYPSNNSFYIYHVKLWSLMNQVVALGLVAGSSEKALSLLLGAAIAALSYVAVGLCAFAVSENAYWGIAAPFLIDFTRAQYVLAVNYPIDFMGTPHTYGALGLAWCILVLALVALERYRIAGLFLGLSPAVHPSLGVWLCTIVGMTFFWNGRDSLPAIRGLWKTAILGVAITIASALLQYSWMRPVLPRIAPDLAARYVSAWVSFFDYHRRPVDLAVPGVRLSLAIVALGVLLVVKLDKTLEARPRFLLRAAVTAAGFALVGAAISRVSADRVPSIVLAFMPTRVFLIANLVYAGVLVGLVGRYRQTATRWLALGLTVCLATRNQTVILFGLVVTGAGVALWILSHSTNTSTAKAAEAATPLRTAVGVALALLSVWGVLNHAATAGTYWGRFSDPKNNMVLEAASKTNGLVAMGARCCMHTQLRTRRPVLVELNGLDQLAYVPESGPAMNEALKAVYGVDLLAPQEILRSSTYDQDLSAIAKPLWEGRSENDWKSVARRFGVTALLVNPQWNLNLPEVARSEELVLYRIGE